MDIEAWLQGLGLERYVPAFRENEIGAEVLAELTGADLATLGLPLGPRRKLVKRSRRCAKALCRRPHPLGDRPRGRAAAADGDVLRPRWLDRALGAARPRRPARGD